MSDTPTVPLVLGSAHACSYLDGQMAAEAFVPPDHKVDEKLFGRLICSGFRRSGDLLYKPYCPSCTACLATRIHAPSFSPNRSQRRTLKKNLDLRVRILGPHFLESHYQLFRKYQLARHRDGEMAEMSPEDYVRFLGNPPVDVTRFIEFLDDHGSTVMVVVADVLSDGFSAVYTYFDPVLSDKGLGTYAILWLIQCALEEGLPYVYLGFWIEDSPKMAYKGSFSGLEILSDRGWIPVRPG